MKFMLMFKSDEPLAPGETACKQNLPAMAKLMGELKSAGVVAATEGLLPPDTGARVSYKNGKMTIRDGPFAEAKEMIAGFAIVNVKCKQDAVDLAKQFLEIAGTGESDVVQVFESH